MQKLLIADSSHIYADALTAALREQFEIRTCTDGQQLLALLPEYRPDILIVNLLLPHIDGITVLRTSSYHPPVVLAIAMYLSAFIQRSIAELGIDYTLIAPSVKTVISQLYTLLDSYAQPPASADLQTQITHHLRLLNIPGHVDGYRYLCFALPMLLENPQQFITKELYPAIAKNCDCRDGRNVEHSIRTAIRSAWLHRDNAIWRKYFTLGPQGSIPCPSNKEFLFRLAELLNEETHRP